MKQVQQEIKTQIWSSAFQHQATIPIGLNEDEEMNRDFGVFINGYFICASTHRLDLSDLQMHEVLEHNECLGIGPSTHRGRPELLVFENFTFYAIDLKSKRIIDEVKFRVDRIQLQNNQGKDFSSLNVQVNYSNSGLTYLVMYVH